MASASTSLTGRPSAAAARTTSSYSGIALTSTPVVAGELHGDRLAVDLDRGHLAVERVLVERGLAQPDRGGVPEDRWSGPRPARSAGTSTDRVWAGRPFFIRIGVSQASLAPASSSAAITCGQTRGSRSSTLRLQQQRRRPGRCSAGSSPTQSRSTLAWPSGSRPPAPTPIALDGHRRLRAPAGRQRGEQRGPGRRAQLHGRGARPVRRTTGRRGAARRPPAAGPAGCRGRRGRCRSRRRPG